MHTADWFWSRVDIRGPSECWVWTKSRIDTGYGQFSEKENGRWRLRRAHRRAYNLTKGPIPKGYDAAPVAAEVIDSEAIRDRAYEQGIRETVGAVKMPLKTAPPIPASQALVPVPAPSIGVDLDRIHNPVADVFLHLGASMPNRGNNYAISDYLTKQRQWMKQ